MGHTVSMHFEHIHRPQRSTRRAPITINNIAYKQREGKYNTPLHTHREYQLFMCVAHGAIATLGETDITLAPGQSVIIPPDTKRKFRQLNQTPQYIILHFEPHATKATAIDNISGIKLSLPPTLGDLLQRLANELSFPGAYESESLLYALNSQLIIELMREAKVYSRNALQEDERVDLLEQFIQNNFHRPIGRDDFANVVSLSPSHVGHLYRSVTGKTLIDRLTEVRIDEAKRLLDRSTLPITYIALEVGFNSFSHFTQLFKRHVGVSPSVYRG